MKQTTEKNIGAPTPASLKKKGSAPKDMQAEADRIVALQKEKQNENKASDRVLLGVFVVLVFLFGILLVALPDKAFSEQENRYLQGMPQLQSRFNGTFIERITEGKFLDRYFDGDFQEEISDYFADQFPARDFFIGLKAATELALGRGENNDVMLGRDDYLIKYTNDADVSHLLSNADAAVAFTEALKQSGIDVTFAVAGRGIDVLQSKYPALYPVDKTDATWRTLADALANTNADYLDLRDAQRPYADNGEEVMYRTDHHWTTLGAYYAYVALMEHWGLEALPLDVFTVEVASEEFYGTTWRSAGMKWVKPDRMEFFRFEGDENYTMRIEGVEEAIKGFYDRSYLEKTDKYSAYIAGNNTLVTIEKDGDEQRERLLIIKDSYGHALAPFLAYHFDLEIIDPRYYRGETAAYAIESACTRALIIENMDSLLTSSVLEPILKGIEPAAEK